MTIEGRSTAIRRRINRQSSIVNRRSIDVLAFGAHPDDVELFAGGTLAKMASRGYATGIVDLTRGELGTRGTPAIRAQEAREAARILGLKVRDNLRFPDSRIGVTTEAQLRVIK